MAGKVFFSVSTSLDGFIAPEEGQTFGPPGALPRSVPTARAQERRTP